MTVNQIFVRFIRTKIGLVTISAIVLILIVTFIYQYNIPTQNQIREKSLREQRIDSIARIKADSLFNSIKIENYESIEDRINNFNISDYGNSEKAAHDGAVELQTLAANLQGFLSSSDSLIIEKAKKEKIRFVTLQRNAYPRLRKAYAEEMKKQLWKMDIDVHLQGKDFNAIRFTSKKFSSNNKVDSYKRAMEMFISDLRFKEAVFESNVRVVRYKFETKDDSEL